MLQSSRKLLHYSATCLVQRAASSSVASAVGGRTAGVPHPSPPTIHTTPFPSGSRMRLRHLQQQQASSSSTASFLASYPLVPPFNVVGNVVGAAPRAGGGGGGGVLQQQQQRQRLPQSTQLELCSPRRLHQGCTVGAADGAGGGGEGFASLHSPTVRQFGNGRMVASSGWYTRRQHERRRHNIYPSPHLSRMPYARSFFSGGEEPEGSPYRILKIQRTATKKEVKMAYLEAARANHPDMNPDDADAQERFQDIARAYQILSDDNERAAYDNSPHSYDTSSSGGGGGGGGYTEQDLTEAEKQFMDVLEEIDVMREVANKYVEDLKDDVEFTKDSVGRGEVEELWYFAKRRKALAGAVLTPLMIVFRMPALALGALRFVPQFFMTLLSVYQRLPTDLKRSVNSFFAEAFMARRASERPTYGGKKKEAEEDDNAGDSDSVDAEDQTWRQRKEYQEKQRKKLEAEEQHSAQQQQPPRKKQQRNPDDFAHEFPWEKDAQRKQSGNGPGAAPQRKPNDFSHEFPWEAEEAAQEAAQERKREEAAVRRREQRASRRKRARPARNKAQK